MARNHRIRKFCAGLRTRRKPFFRIAPGRREASFRDRAPRAAKARALFRIRCLFAITGGSPCSHAARTSGPGARGMFHVKHPYEKTERRNRASDGRRRRARCFTGNIRKEGDAPTLERRRAERRAHAGQAADGGRGMGAGGRPTGRRGGAGRDRRGRGGRTGRRRPDGRHPGARMFHVKHSQLPAPSAVNARGARPRPHLRLRARRRGCSTRA